MCTVTSLSPPRRLRLASCAVILGSVSCADLRLFLSVRVQESWVEQFHPDARAFAKAFSATQHFSLYCDERLRGLELRDGAVGALFDVKL